MPRIRLAGIGGPVQRPWPLKTQNPSGNVRNRMQQTLKSIDGDMSELKTSSRRTINLPGRPAALPFSDAVLVGDTLYLSGRIGIDPVTGRAPADLDAEIKLLLDGVEAVLAEG